MCCCVIPRARALCWPASWIPPPERTSRGLYPRAETPCKNNAIATSAAFKRGDGLISEVAHPGTDGESLIEITNFGDQEVDVTDLRVDVANQFKEMV